MQGKRACQKGKGRLLSDSSRGGEAPCHMNSSTQTRSERVGPWGLGLGLRLASAVCASWGGGGDGVLSPGTPALESREWHAAPHMVLRG
eukprot:1087386-Prymnesium_polylepis.2